MDKEDIVYLWQVWVRWHATCGDIRLPWEDGGLLVDVQRYARWYTYTKQGLAEMGGRLPYLARKNFFVAARKDAMQMAIGYWFVWHAMPCLRLRVWSRYTESDSCRLYSLPMSHTRWIVITRCQRRSLFHNIRCHIKKIRVAFQHLLDS